MNPINNYFNYQNKVLCAENVPIPEIIQAVGTPCYIYSHTALVQQWQAFDEALQDYPHQICYSVKANSNLAVLQTLANIGSGFDIVSGGELARVIAAGGSPQKIVFSGVGKQPEEIASALNKGIYCFNLESEAEMNITQQIAQHFNVLAPIAFRVNPNIDSKSHPYISTGLRENKFGVDIDEAVSLYLKANQLSHLSIQGVACHIGSQLTSLSPFLETFQRLSRFILNVKSHGILLNHLDVGGGLGVCYRNENPPSPKEYITTLLNACKDLIPLLILEPGRAISCQGGILVTKVLYLKDSEKKNFCITDCAMNDLIRPMLYQAWQNIIPVVLHSYKGKNYDIVGPVCESGDFLGKDRELAINPGEYLAILSSGAYGFVMSSNYNSRPRSCEVMVKGNDFKIVRKRETVPQLFSEECLW